MNRGSFWKLPLASNAERTIRRLMLGCVVLFLLFALALSAAVLSSPKGIRDFAFAGAFVSFGGGLIAYLNLRRWHPIALKRLREARYRTCPGCGYDLSGCGESGSCPECALAFSPESLQETWEAVYKRLMPEVVSDGLSDDHDPATGGG